MAHFEYLSGILGESCLGRERRPINDSLLLPPLLEERARDARDLPAVAETAVDENSHEDHGGQVPADREQGTDEDDEDGEAQEFHGFHSTEPFAGSHRSSRMVGSEDKKPQKSLTG